VRAFGDPGGVAYKCDCREDADAISNSRVDIDILNGAIMRISRAGYVCKWNNVPTRQIYGGLLRDAAMSLGRLADRFDS